MTLRRILAGTAVSALAVTTLAACGSDETDSASKDDTIVVGTTDLSMPSWSVFQDIAEENGFNLELKNFAEYSTPNPALSQGELDANKFQHLMFLAEHNKGSGDDLAPLVSTEIYPLALYWDGHDELDVDEIEGEDIAIPNDTTNQARALLVLKQAELVEFTEDDLLSPTPADIDQDASKVTVTPVDAAQTTNVYNEGTPAVINNSFLERAGIDPQAAIFQDDPNNEEAEPYINVWAVRKDDLDNEALKELAGLWADERVAEAVQEESGGTAVAVDRPQEELQEILDRLEEQL